MGVKTRLNTRPDVWVMADATWKYKEFDPTTSVYLDTQSKIGKRTDISYNAKVALMGEIDGKKLKDEYTETRTESSRVVVSYNMLSNSDR